MHIYFDLTAEKKIYAKNIKYIFSNFEQMSTKIHVLCTYASIVIKSVAMAICISYIISLFDL